MISPSEALRANLISSNTNDFQIVNNKYVFITYNSKPGSPKIRDTYKVVDPSS
jgi:hypothetical protein